MCIVAPHLTVHAASRENPPVEKHTLSPRYIQNEDRAVFHSERERHWQCREVTAQHSFTASPGQAGSKESDETSRWVSALNLSHRDAANRPRRRRASVGYMRILTSLRRSFVRPRRQRDTRARTRGGRGTMSKGVLCIRCISERHGGKVARAVRISLPRRVPPAPLRCRRADIYAYDFQDWQLCNANERVSSQIARYPVRPRTKQSADKFSKHLSLC